MKTYKVDLDYEASLFDPAYQEDSSASRKIIREFEYVFFLVEKEKSILKNYKDYDKIYLEHLKKLGFTIPDFNPAAKDFVHWWGHHHNSDIERTLNSKLTSAKMASEKGFGFHEGAIVNNQEEVLAHLKKFPDKETWLLKRPYSFSGIGHYQFQATNPDTVTIGKILSGPCLLEPVYERVFDIGTTFVINDAKIEKSFMVENFNTEKGRFSGGAGAPDVGKFKKYILEKYQFDLGELESITAQIAEEYLKLGAVSNVQIDSFVYRENGELKLYPLVEVNYRKTMGVVIQALAEKFGSVVEWIIQPATQPMPDQSEWKKISPEGNHFQSFFRNLILK